MEKRSSLSANTANTFKNYSVLANFISNQKTKLFIIHTYIFSLAQCQRQKLYERMKSELKQKL